MLRLALLVVITISVANPARGQGGPGGDPGSNPTQTSPEDLASRLKIAEEAYRQSVDSTRTKIDEQNKLIEALKADLAQKADLKKVSDLLSAIEARDGELRRLQQVYADLQTTKWQVRLTGALTAFSIVARGTERIHAGLSLRGIDDSLLKLANPIAVFPEIPGQLQKAQAAADKVLNFSIPPAWSALPFVGQFLQPVATLLSSTQKKVKDHPLMKDFDKIMFASDVSIRFETFRQRRSERILAVARTATSLGENLESTASAILDLAGVEVQGGDGKARSSLLKVLPEVLDYVEGRFAALGVADTLPRSDIGAEPANQATNKAKAPGADGGSQGAPKAQTKSEALKDKPSAAITPSKTTGESDLDAGKVLRAQLELDRLLTEFEPFYTAMTAHVRDFEAISRTYVQLSINDLDELKALALQVADFPTLSGSKHLGEVSERYLKLLGCDMDGKPLDRRVGPIHLLEEVSDNDREELLLRDVNLAKKLLIRSTLSRTSPARPR